MARSRKLRFVVALAVVALGSVVFGTLQTEAKKGNNAQTFKSTVEILVANTTSFSGTVTSEDPRCVPNRTVVVKQLGKGANEPVGTTVTAADGSWTITNTRGTGRFFARVKKATLTGYGNKIICKKDDTKHNATNVS